ncbi:kinase-like domain-containing protein [Xylaria cubensis]|nr:kinase-like domain-containing protein [Xylaria cubensis]
MDPYSNNRPAPHHSTYPGTPSSFFRLFSPVFRNQQRAKVRQPHNPPQLQLQQGYAPANYFNQNPSQDQYRSCQSQGGNAYPGLQSRTAGSAPQKQRGACHQKAPVLFEQAFQPAPERNPEAYGRNALNNQKRCSQLAADFFTDSVKRARERNQRQTEVEEKLSEVDQTPGDASTPKRRQIWQSAGKIEGRYLRLLRTKDKPENYSTIKVIGKGAFGKVQLVRKTDGRVYAMKSLVKSEMLRGGQLAHVRAERDILAECNSPWVVKLHTAFQDNNLLYMLMEFLPGGDLMSMLIKYQIFSQDITKFYMAELVLAIDAVHKLGFIHRDIKPDNILLDRWGHLKLTDFGLSTGFHKLHENSYYQQLLQRKCNRPRDSTAIEEINLTVSNRAQIDDWRRSRRLMAYSAVGTPDYVAPEVIDGYGYSFDCDWWSLGTIMFECLIGWPPFFAYDREETYLKVLNWRYTLCFPDNRKLSHEAKHLICSLICNTENRLGHVSGGHEIKTHSFFRGVNFDYLRYKRAPFEPRLTSNIDTSYFPTEEFDQTDTAQVIASGQQSEELDTSLPFIGYTFKRFDKNFR